MRLLRGQGRVTFIRPAPSAILTQRSASATQAQTASLAIAAVPPFTLTATQTQTASVVTATAVVARRARTRVAPGRRSRAATTGFLGVFGVYTARIVAHPNLAATQAQTASLASRITAAFSATFVAAQTQTASLAIVATRPKTLSATQTQTASQATLKGSPGPLGFKTYGSGSYPTISVGSLHFSGGSQDGDMGLGNSTTGAIEPSVYYDGSTWHMWYHRLNSDASLNSIQHATSSFPDGPWTDTGAVVAGSYQCPQVVYQSGTFHLTATNVANSSRTVDYYTASSASGPWTLVQAAILSVGATGQWDDLAIGNTFPYWDGSQWWMFYDALNSSSYGTGVAWNFGTWRVGIATGPSLNSLTKSGSNPIFDLAPGLEGGRMIGSTYVTRGASGKYFCFLHEEDNGNSGTAFLTPTSLAVWESTALGSGWRRVGWLHRLFNNPAAKLDQIADPFLYEQDGNTHLYFDSAPAQTPYNQFRIGHAFYPGTIEGVVNAVRFSPVSNTSSQPTVNTGQVVLTVNSGAQVTPIKMDGTNATALGADPGTSQTAGTYYLSGTTLKLGTTGKTHVTIAASGATPLAVQSQTATLSLVATYVPRQVFAAVSDSVVTYLQLSDAPTTNLTVSDAAMNSLVPSDR